MTNDFGQNWPGGRSADDAGNQGYGGHEQAWGNYPEQQPGQYGAYPAQQDQYAYGSPVAPSGNDPAWATGNPYGEHHNYGMVEKQKSGNGLKIAAVTLPILALAVGVGAGYLLFDEGVDAETVAELESERDALQGSLNDTQAQVEAREADITSLEQQLEDAQTQSGDLDARSAELDERESGLDARELELDERETTLDERETAGGEDPEPGATITEGVWTVGLDIEPGTYRVTEEISSEQFCYWAIYATGTNHEEIITNSIPTGGFPQVTLEEGQDFESSDCGTWEQR